MNHLRSASLTMLVLIFLSAWMAPVSASNPVVSASVRWDCPVPMLRDAKIDGTSSPDVGEGVSYLYSGDEKHLHSNYGADALFTVPIDGRQGWYDGAVRLGPRPGNNGFVQIEISRWKRFDYRQHIAVAWALPHSSVEHRDTALMLADGVPHRLGIYVHLGQLQLVADERLICSTPSSYFVKASGRKYFQVRTETSVVGSNGATRVSNLRLKRDGDVVARPFATDCVLHRNGIFWEQISGGAFAVRGAFYPNEATFFTGIDPSKPCRT